MEHVSRVLPRPEPMTCSCGEPTDVCGDCGSVRHASSLVPTRDPHTLTGRSTRCRDPHECGEHGPQRISRVTSDVRVRP